MASSYIYLGFLPSSVQFSLQNSFSASVSPISSFYPLCKSSATSSSHFPPPSTLPNDKDFSQRHAHVELIEPQVPLESLSLMQDLQCCHLLAELENISLEFSDDASFNTFSARIHVWWHQRSFQTDIIMTDPLNRASCPKEQQHIFSQLFSIPQYSSNLPPIAASDERALSGLYESMGTYSDDQRHRIKQQQIRPSSSSSSSSSAVFTPFSAFSSSSSTSTQPILPHPPGLRPTLRPYQQIAVRWMLQREGKIPKDDDHEPLHPLYQRIPLSSLSNDELDEAFHFFFPSSSLSTEYSNLYINPCTMNASLECPPFEDIKGGIIGEEVGLGKSVEILSLILSNPREISPQNSSSSSSHSSFLDLIPAKSSLILCPGTIAQQWLDEIAKHGPPADQFKVLFWEGIRVEDEKLQRLNAEKNKRDKKRRNEDSKNQRKRSRSTNKKQNDAIVEGEGEENKRLKSETEVATQADPVAMQNGDLPPPPLPLEPQAAPQQEAEGIEAQGEEAEIQPLTAEQMAQYDIVLCSYETLKNEIYHSNPFPDKAFRHAKKYQSRVSPLLSLDFHRICLDEAQMVDSGVSSAALLARQLSATHRFCCSGTPVRTSLEDFHGLFLFLQHPVFSSSYWWKKALLDPFLFNLSVHLSSSSASSQFPKDTALQSLLQQIMWRTAKKHVVAEIGIPPQRTLVQKLELSRIEKSYSERIRSESLAALGWSDDFSMPTVNFTPEDARIFAKANIRRVAGTVLVSSASASSSSSSSFSAADEESQQMMMAAEDEDDEILTAGSLIYRTILRLRQIAIHPQIGADDLMSSNGKRKISSSSSSVFNPSSPFGTATYSLGDVLEDMIQKSIRNVRLCRFDLRRYLFQLACIASEEDIEDQTRKQQPVDEKLLEKAFNLFERVMHMETDEIGALDEEERRSSSASMYNQEKEKQEQKKKKKQKKSLLQTAGLRSSSSSSAASSSNAPQMIDGVEVDDLGFPIVQIGAEEDDSSDEESGEASQSGKGRGGSISTDQSLKNMNSSDWRVFHYATLYNLSRLCDRVGWDRKSSELKSTAHQLHLLLTHNGPWQSYATQRAAIKVSTAKLETESVQPFFRKAIAIASSSSSGNRRKANPALEKLCTEIKELIQMREDIIRVELGSLLPDQDHPSASGSSSASPAMSTLSLLSSSPPPSTSPDSSASSNPPELMLALEIGPDGAYKYCNPVTDIIHMSRFHTHHSKFIEKYAIRLRKFFSQVKEMRTASERMQELHTSAPSEEELERVMEEEKKRRSDRIDSLIGEIFSDNVAVRGLLPAKQQDNKKPVDKEGDGQEQEQRPAVQAMDAMSAILIDARKVIEKMVKEYELLIRKLQMSRDAYIAAEREVLGCLWEWSDQDMEVRFIQGLWNEDVSSASSASASLVPEQIEDEAATVLRRDVRRRILEREGEALEKRIKEKESRLKYLYNLKTSEGNSAKKTAQVLIEEEKKEEMEDVQQEQKQEQVDDEDSISGVGLSSAAAALPVDDQDEGLCPICHEATVRPTATPCLHLFCADCLFSYLRFKHRGLTQKTRVKCPQCKESFAVGDLKEVDRTSLAVSSSSSAAAAALSSSSSSLFMNQSSSSSSTAMIMDDEQENTRNNFILPERAESLRSAIEAMPIDGSYGTKVDFLVKSILHMRSTEPDSKCLIFTEFREAVNLVCAALRKNSIGYARLDAAETRHSSASGRRSVAARRAAEVKRFVTSPPEEVTCFVMDLRTGSAGLTLVAASRIYLLEPILSPSIQAQAVGRINRIGQTKRTLIVQLIAKDTIEERIYALRQSRRIKTLDENSRTSMHMQDKPADEFSQQTEGGDEGDEEDGDNSVMKPVGGTSHDEIRISQVKYLLGLSDVLPN